MEDNGLLQLFASLEHHLALFLQPLGPPVEKSQLRDHFLDNCSFFLVLSKNGVCMVEDSSLKLFFNLNAPSFLLLKLYFLVLFLGKLLVSFFFNFQFGELTVEEVDGTFHQH